MTSEQLLEALTESTAQAVAGVLETLCPGAAKPAGVSAQAGDTPGLPAGPVVAARVEYPGGGGSVFAMPVESGRSLAAAMTGEAAAQEGGAKLSEAERGSVAEAMRQVMAAAAAAAGRMLGRELAVSPPSVEVHDAAESALEGGRENEHTALARFELFGAPAALLQLVPGAILGREAGAGGVPLADSLRDVPVKLWAELGRTRMQTGRLVDLPAGAVVELDRRADDPVDVFVNGMRFATGRLIVVDGSEWAVRIEEVP
jgi:flagellar motor switch protein FliN/FliY